jgi:hypothetical protein
VTHAHSILAATTPFLYLLEWDSTYLVTTVNCAVRELSLSVPDISLSKDFCHLVHNTT